jgi:hypothetical protein
VSPSAPSAALRAPQFAAAAGTGIVLDQYAGVLGETGTEIGQGFNPTNPHRGDAIVATFFWAGSTNTITKVVDHLSDADGTPVGNTYTLVEYVTAGEFSMATYVATNVQNFPDPNPDDATVLNVDAIFSSPVTNAGVSLSAWTGVNAVAAQALGAHRSATGVASGISAVGPGLGTRVTSFNGPVTIVMNGVATFSDLSIDHPGNGYTLVVRAGGVTGAESAPFNIGAF